MGGLAPYLGYATCYAWTFCMSSIYEFGGTPTARSFLLRVLPGLLAGMLVLALTCRGMQCRPSGHLFRFMHTPIPAFLASFGTLLAAVPEFAQVPSLPLAGCICAGFFFLFVLAQWGLAFAHLEWRRILGLSGISFFLAASIAFVVAWMPLNAAAFITSLLPLSGFACLRALPCDFVKSPDSAAASAACGLPVWRSLPWKTFAGLFSIFFAYNGVVATCTVGKSWLGNADASFLILPAILAMAFAGVGHLCAGKQSLSFVAKAALAAVALPFMLIAYALDVPAEFAFADGLAMYTTAWIILVYAVKDAAETNRVWDANRALAVFCLGWLAQTAGGALAYLVAPLSQHSTMLYAFLMIAFVIVAGVEFFTTPRLTEDAGLGGLRTEREEVIQGTTSLPVNANAMQPSTIESFCREHNLSPRETEVFALWVTGHGVRDITQKLCMSQSTVKTHVRHIYDKCEVYGKAKLLEAFEDWATSHKP